MHFSSPYYDYVKYNGKVKANESSFSKKNNVYHFHKLSKKLDLEKFLIANFFVDDRLWIGELFEPKAHEIYLEYNKRQAAMTYRFKEEIKKIDNLNEWIKTDGKYPKLYVEYKQGRISPETLIIMNDVLDIFNYWARNIQDPILYPEQMNKLNKLRPFVKYDKEKYTEILKQNFR